MPRKQNIAHNPSRATVLPNSTTLLQLWQALGSKLIQAAQGQMFYTQEVIGSNPISPTTKQVSTSLQKFTGELLTEFLKSCPTIA
jgi:hypothetical protein